MEPNKKLTPQFFFLSVGVLVTLLASVISFLNLFFEILNHVLPDVLTANYQYGYTTVSYESMRSSVAMVIIVFPVFLIISRFWIQLMRGELSRWDTIIRKWVLYLILFLASVSVIADLVTLVRYFVSGEITLRFILKVVAVLFVAALAWWYYVRQIRSVDTSKIQWLVTIKSIVWVLAVVIWSFFVMGSPMTQRVLRLDQRRIDDLQSLQWQVINFWQQKQRLPKSLDELTNPISNYAVPTDPEFQKGNVYEYAVTGDKTFELCATFDKPIPKGWVDSGLSQGGIVPMDNTAVSTMPVPAGTGDNWDHGIGRTCFDRTIDPDLYPPYPKPAAK